MYKEGQTINIGYYGGFQNRELIKAQAEVISVDDSTLPAWVTIRVKLPSGGCRNMFGYSHQLKALEENFNLGNDEQEVER